MSGYDVDGYQIYERPSSYTKPDQLTPGVLYPGGGHVTWGKSRPPERRWTPAQAATMAEPEGAAAERRRHRAEDKQHDRAGDYLAPIDPDDPWSECEWRTPEPK